MQDSTPRVVHRFSLAVTPASEPPLRIRLLTCCPPIESNHIFLQPLFPLLSAETARDAILNHTIEDNSRGNMNSLHAVHLHQNLQIIGDLVAGIQAPILTRFITDPKEFEHF